MPKSPLSCPAHALSAFMRRDSLASAPNFLPGPRGSPGGLTAKEIGGAWRDIWVKAIATPMDATGGCLWAEGVADEILLFWQGQRLLALPGPNGGRSLVMLTSRALCADYGGRAYFLMAG